MPNTSRRRRSYNRRNTPQKSQAWSGTWGSKPNPTSARKNPTSNYNYTMVRSNLQNKINAYRYLFDQCKTTGPYKPSPAVINKFANWVNKGAMLHKVSGASIAKWCKDHKPTYTMSWATKGLKSKYGVAIKGLYPTGNGKWYMVATNPTFKGKPFRFPNR